MRKNLFRLVSLIMSLSLSLCIISCGSSDDEDCNKPEPSTNNGGGTSNQSIGLLGGVLNNGTYETECMALGETAFLKMQINLNDNKIELMQRVYSNEECVLNSQLYGTEVVYNLSKVDKKEGNVYGLSLTVVRGLMTVVSDDEDILDAFNAEEGYYGYTDWAMGVTHDITNQSAPEDLFFIKEVSSIGEQDESDITVNSKTSFVLDEVELSYKN